MQRKNINNISRRSFIKSVLITTAGVGGLFNFVRPDVLGRDGAVPPSEKIIMGGLGIGPRGMSDLQIFLHEPDVRFIAVADAQASRRNAVKSMVDNHYGDNKCEVYSDFRKLLERKDIDALLIATGDRWHALASILAAKAGKDMYCEKPCSMTIAESIELRDTIRRYARVYQAGTQRRSVGNFVFAVELARKGKLGKLVTVHANTLHPATSHDWLPEEPLPPKEEVDWDEWLGPNPWRPFNKRYVQGGWRGYFDFHGGGILEWGSHTVDLCQWANNADDTAPIEYEPNPDGVVAKYANGVKLVMRSKGWLGLGTCSVRFEGENGWVETGDGGEVKLEPESLRGGRKILTESVGRPMSHIRNFLDCVKSRGQPAANADVSCQSHIACHAAYIAWQLNRKLLFDPVKVEFIGDEEANRMKSRAYREPYRA
jgi:predicted dehydrogenase